MTNTGRRHRADRKRALALLFALIGVAAAGTACADQPAGMAATPTAVIAAEAGMQAPAVTTIGEAAFYGDIDVVEQLLGEGADVNEVTDGLTPLMWSFQPVIEPPTTSGPDPEALRAFTARQLRKLRIAELLLGSGVDVARADRNGMTALHYLVLMNADEDALLETLRAFMARGADPDVANDDGMTPLMFAAFRNRVQLATYLLSAGADPRATAKDDRTALSIARARGHAELAALLERELQ